MSSMLGTDTSELARIRLLHILSPALPTGAYSYSQGIETAVELGWIAGVEDFSQWITEQIQGSLHYQELPLIIRLYEAASRGDEKGFDEWSHIALAWRDTSESRDEEQFRGVAFLRILESLPDPVFQDLPVASLRRSALAGIAWAGAKLEIALNELLLAYAHTWLETTITSGVKLIPLGQSQGQSLQYSLTPLCVDAVQGALMVGEDDIGYANPAISIASCRHETQYTRIYRS
ncbi:MAG: urease accessory protein UreF [Granulosicoccus sp.]|nr:urease accessory protein UreF [Granulosicoccus sp.]